MLSRLYIKNYALIENLDIQFDRGLNIITGETGAGKSIIMGALGLILGNRVEGKHFFNEQQKCVIEGYFAIEAYGLQDFFAEQDLDYEEETIIRREITPDGKSRAFVNDSPVTLNVLKALGEQLINIHSQHATLQINTEKFQFLVLDSVAKNQNLSSDYKNAFRQYKEIKEQLTALQELIVSNNAELDFNQFQFEELNKANLQAGEQQQLEDEQQQLTHAEEIKRNLLGAAYLLEEQETAVIISLKGAVQHLLAVQEYLPAGKEWTERLESTFIEIKDIAQEINHGEQQVYMDENRLQEVEDRLSLLYSLQKKHRVDTVEELIAVREQLEQKILAVTNQEEYLATLKSAVETSHKVLEDAASALSQSRKGVVDKVGNYVQEVLAKVGMPNAQLQINLTQLPIEGFKQSGGDEVQFLFSANKGQALQPIHKVASGGELSRVMLAVKSLVAQSSALPTIIFDEIDTGISGEVALKVGDIMQQLAGNMQVLAITHLPQIAAKGQAHFKVYKQDEGEKTKTNIGLLSKEEKIQEVAQMLSGANPGESALQHAKELIEEAN
ncbi:DNA repair protein RecN [Sphingobacterium wenxiniae]|uniref:DNA repair protein RecN n=1 Tax=Sphingobacterium wenxiniae TaxID=683125 RepID=A0A1I6VW20_9SPHI|nr:DNA repair protein RecN [Sphingobacterium wenxiniae]SFT17908.1 DNA replication and repair protein RecN [Sphingobacterium wenxiniae]